MKTIDVVAVDGHVTGGAAARPEPCILVIFGASGDLTKRKLVPALYQLFIDNQLPKCFRIIGFARSKKSNDSLHEELRDALIEFKPGVPVDGEKWNEFAKLIEYFQGDYDSLESYNNLAAHLMTINLTCSSGNSCLFYLATPPELSRTIIGNLRSAQLIHPVAAKAWSRVIIEKPFGRDLASAQELNAFVRANMDESQIYRIDHYLGKETVQNILVFRFANAIFEPLWNRNHIDHVQITASETIGVAGRAGFYDTAGVIRDFVQNHLLEVMSLIAMEQPVSFKADPVRDEKVKVLRSLRPVGESEVGEHAVFGQYNGYQDIEGVRPDSRTPTYAALRVMVDNWRWQGVPFYLRAGKALASRVTEVNIHFKRVPFCLFGHDEVCQRLNPNILTIRIQPDEGICLKFGCKTPGDQLVVSDVAMDFGYANVFGREAPDAYQRLLVDAMRGDATLFSRSDAVEHAWAFITPFLKAFESDDSLPLAGYVPGSNGPVEADKLLARDNKRFDSL